MSNIIEVTVTGTAGSGKSTVCELIQRALCDAGLEATITEQEWPEAKEQINLPARVYAISSRAQITITEQQAKRKGTQHNAT